MEDEAIEAAPVPTGASLRRSLTVKNSVTRHVVNLKPSRLHHNTLKKRLSNSEHDALLDEVVEGEGETDRQMDIIVREMEHHLRFIEDHPGANEMRRVALRDLPQGMTMKRSVRAKLSASLGRGAPKRRLPFWRILLYMMGFYFKRARDRFRDLAFSVELWYEAIRSIEGHFGSSVASYFYFLRWLFLMNLVMCVGLVSFVVVPQAIHNHHRTTGGWSFLNFFSGKGGLEDSLLFYGHYLGGRVARSRYDMTFAYFFTMLAAYLIVFAVLCYRTAASYRLHFISSVGGRSVRRGLAHKLFCSWHAGVTAPAAARTAHTALYLQLQEIVNEMNSEKHETTFIIKLLHCLVNVLVNVIVLGLIMALQYGLWLLLKSESWGDMLVPGLLTAVVSASPVVFGLLVKVEYYRVRTALYCALGRAALLQLASLTLLLYYCAHSHMPCWETSFGQEAYRLVLLDSIVSLLVLPAIEFLRAMIYKMYPKGGGPEFNIVYNSLTLIYNQAVLWYGMVFSPLLVVVVTVKFLLLFYIKKECVFRACQPARKIWRASQTQTVMYMLVTFSLFVTLFAFGCLFLGAPSTCGPLLAYSSPLGVIRDGTLQLSSRPRAAAALAFVARPAVIGFAALLLGVSVYYMRAVAGTRRRATTLLQRLLRLQAKDREFLLTAITKVSAGEWMYSRKPNESQDSHTWKYLKEVRKPSNSGYHFDASRLSHSLIEGRPRSYLRERPISSHKERDEDGDTDSSFSWKGSSNCLNVDKDDDRKSM